MIKRDRNKLYCYKRFPIQINTDLLHFIFFKESWKKGFHKKLSNKNLKFSILLIRIIIKSQNQHIRMISESSCDIEDWSNE